MVKLKSVKYKKFVITFKTLIDGDKKVVQSNVSGEPWIQTITKDKKLGIAKVKRILDKNIRLGNI